MEEKDKMTQYFIDLKDNAEKKMFAIVNAPKNGRIRKDGTRIASINEKREIDKIIDEIEKLKYTIDAVQKYFELNN